MHKQEDQWRSYSALLHTQSLGRVGGFLRRCDMEVCVCLNIASEEYLLCVSRPKPELSYQYHPVHLSEIRLTSLSCYPEILDQSRQS
jgi:hypothetical protein